MPLPAVRPTVPLREHRMDGLVLRQASFSERRVPSPTQRRTRFHSPLKPLPQDLRTGKGSDLPLPQIWGSATFAFASWLLLDPFQEGQVPTATRPQGEKGRDVTVILQGRPCCPALTAVLPRVPGPADV